MPLYEALCQKCGRQHEYYAMAANCYDTPVCCGQPAQKVILSAPMGYVQNIAYTSPIDGRPITTTHARRDDLARNGCRPWEGMEQEQKEAKRRQQYIEQKQDAKLDAAVQTAWHQLAPEKRQALEAAA